MIRAINGVSMSENKTKQTTASPEKYFAAIKDEQRRNDCERLSALMRKATKQPPAMWGPSIVGFGSYHYKYDSGREGDMCAVGFSSRKEAVVLYVGSEFSGAASMLTKLGKHKAGKGCLYIKKLDDVDTTVLEKLIAAAYKHRMK
jgi:hypothetical protein